MAPLILTVVLANISITGTLQNNLEDSVLSDSGQRDLQITSPTEQNSNSRDFQVAQDSKSGTMDPIPIKQSGVQVTDTVSAMTDSGTNTINQIPIDDTNGWSANKVKLEVSNLQRLYIENGTFDSIEPWNFTTNDGSGGSQIQTATYDSAEDYVIAQNNGSLINNPQQIYRHYAGTEVLWQQEFLNYPYTQNFSLTFEFMYISGPLDPLGNDGLTPIYISIWFSPDGVSDWSGWGWYLTRLEERNTWYVLDDIPVNLDNPGNPGFFQIGLYYPYTADYQGTQDYDDDGTADGRDNAKCVEVIIDNVKMVGLNSPTYEEVELSLNSGVLSDAVSSQGLVGTATINNPGLWTGSSVPIEITSNVSVAFDYFTTTTYQRYINSTWVSHPAKEGVSYSVNAGQSVSLTLYTYIGTFGEYVNFSLDIEHPTDWENVTVRTPFLEDVTGQCTLATGLIQIPTDILDQFGWWEISLEAPNYAQSVKTQIYRMSVWQDESTFRSGNESRVQIQLGTALDTPVIDSPVNISWVLPNGTIWADEMITTGALGLVSGAGWNLGALNTSAGLWTVECVWTNGTEVAFNDVTFSIYHATTLTPINPVIDTDHGLIITNMLYYVDVDNGDYLMDDSATINGNWSTYSISFAPNYVRNWWEADIDTDVLPAGEYIVIVSASRPYYDDVSCMFTVRSTYTTTISLSNETVQTVLNTQNLILLNYRYTNGSGIESANFDISYSGPAGGLSWNPIINPVPGEYELRISGSISGTYQVSVTGYKTYHENATDSFAMTVNVYDSNLSVENGTVDITSVSHDYRLVVRYTRNGGSGLENATVIVDSMLPASGLTIGTISDLGNGYYSIMLDPISVAIYNVVLRANVTNHAVAYASFALTVTKDPMTLTLAIETETIGVTENYLLNMTLVTEDLVGIQGATISVLNPPSGLYFNTVQDHLDGNYSILIESLQFGTYLITLSASLPNYQSSIDTFTLIVDEISTKLIVVNGSADFAEFNKQYNLVVRYTNSTGTGLPGADIQVVNVTPGVGLLYGSFQPEDDGYYSILIQPNQAAVFTILISANLTNHQVQYGTFTLTVREISTILHLNITSTKISVADTLTVGITFTDLEGVGISGADIEISNPPAGLSFINHEDHLNGNYSFQLVPATFGSFLITISATLDNYQDGFASFSVVIDEIGTELIRLNASSDIVRIGESYRLVLRYQNSTSGGLEGATIAIVDINPEVGLGYENATYLTDGYYAILLTPSLTSTYTIAIRANLTNYVTQIVTFTLTVSEIPTILTIDRASATISVDKEYLVELYFADDGSHPLENATIIILDIPEGITYEVEDITGGYYHVLLNPSSVGTSQIAFRATLTNYHNSTVGFTLSVRTIPTTLVPVGGESRGSILFKEHYELSLLYIRTDTDENISLAEIDVQASPMYGISWDILEIDEFYTISIKTNTTGTWSLYITANKSQYFSANTQFRLDVMSIETDINEFTLLEPLVYDRSYNFTFSYLMANDTGVTQAGIQYSGSAADWVSYIELGNGQYRLSLIPKGIGNQYVILYFTRDGFQGRSSTLTFSVVPVAISVVDIQGLTALEGQANMLSLRLVETDTSEPVTGVSVQYQFVSETIIGELNALEEGQPGTYSATIIMPSADSNTKLRIYIDSDYYEMVEGYFDADLTPTQSTLSIITRTFTRYFPLWIGIGAVVVALGGRRVYNKKKREQTIKALEIKKRFDDVNSILGVIVLHKISGIPLYSKIVKGGIDEILISGFISAITQFRGEFDVDQENFVVTPISDIIRAVATENLICAFITLTAPSHSLERKMVQYAETVGFIFDHQFTEAPMKVLDNGTMTQFDILFDEVLDGSLIQKYRIQDVKGLPRKTKCLQKEIGEIAQSEAFMLDELVSRMTGCGLEESYVYLSIWNAIEKKQIQMLDLKRFEEVSKEVETDDLE